MQPSLKEQRQANRWYRGNKNPFRRIIRIYDADMFMKTEQWRRAQAWSMAEKYHENNKRNFTAIWQKIVELEKDIPSGE